MTRDEWAELVQCMKALDAAKREKLLSFLQALKAKGVIATGASSAEHKTNCADGRG